MFNRVIVVLFVVINYVSCNYFSSKSNKSDSVLDTIINFTKVDVSPSFKVCDKLLDEAKTNCFRLNIHQQITKHLKKVIVVFEEDINETIVNVILTINNKGKITLKEILTTDAFTTTNTSLEEELIEAIRKLPTLSPAIKRGIPVETEYTLPIKIKVAE